MEAFLKIQITPANNGIKVLVGCHEFVWQQENVGSFLKDLDLYLHDPEAARKLVFKRWGINEEASHDQPDAPASRVHLGDGAKEVREVREDREVADETVKEMRETTQAECEDPGPPRERSR